MEQPRAPVNSIVDPVIVTILCFGWFIVGSLGAVAAGFPVTPFDDSSFRAIVLFEITFAAAALGFLRYRG